MKIIIPILIIFSVFFISNLSVSGDVCLPDGCIFGGNLNGNACDYNSCVDETLSQHLGERTLLADIVVKFRLVVVFSAGALFLLFAFKDYLSGSDELLIARPGKKCSKAFNYLDKAFSDGILHPQIYFA